MKKNKAANMNVIPATPELSKEDRAYFEAYIRHKERAPDVSITTLARQLDSCCLVIQAQGEAHPDLEARLMQYFGRDPSDELYALEELILNTPARNSYEALIVTLILSQKLECDGAAGDENGAAIVPEHLIKAYKSAAENVMQGMLADGVRVPEGIQYWYVYSHFTHQPRADRISDLLRMYQSDRERRDQNKKAA